MKIIELRETEQVTDKFSKRLVVVEETKEKYPKQIAIEFANDRIKMLNGLKVGDSVCVEFTTESREHQGRWYTTARGLSIELKASPAKDVPQVPKDDLPF